MNMLKADEDLPIEANIISGAINNSQKKVEAHNFDIRKHVLQYDDVINTQREVIYRERRMILEGADIHSTIESMISEHIDSLVYSQISPNQPVDVWFDDSKGPSPIAKLFESLKADFTENVLKKIDQPESFKQSGFDPLLLQIKNSVKEIYTQKEQTLGVEIVREAERQILLHVIDTKWIEHLHAMDSLKDGIHLQGYGQKDPLIEYKKESFDMFDNLLEEIRRDAVVLLFHAQVVKKSKNPKLVSKS
jgi:preprotein translocase subunit SecA